MVVGGWPPLVVAPIVLLPYGIVYIASALLVGVGDALPRRFTRFVRL